MEKLGTEDRYTVDGEEKADLIMMTDAAEKRFFFFLPFFWLYFRFLCTISESAQRFRRISPTNKLTNLAMDTVEEAPIKMSAGETVFIFSG